MNGNLNPGTSQTHDLVSDILPYVRKRKRFEEISPEQYEHLGMLPMKHLIHLYPGVREKPPLADFNKDFNDEFGENFLRNPEDFEPFKDKEGNYSKEELYRKRVFVKRMKKRMDFAHNAPPTRTQRVIQTLEPELKGDVQTQQDKEYADHKIRQLLLDKLL